MIGDALAYEIGGPTEAPVLLLIHPMGADRHFWDACRKRWETHLRCVAIDLRGAGASSPRAGHPIPPADHAGDIERLRLDLGLGQVVIVGCAVGAMVAVAYAARCPGACRGLVLSNPGLRTEPPAREALARRAEAVQLHGLAAILPDTLDVAFDSSERTPTRDAFERRFAAQNAEQYALQLEAILDADISADLPKLQCPVLLVAGGRDRLLPPRQARAMAEALRSVWLVQIENGAHFLPIQQPEIFASIAEGFIARSR